ncbi:MAG TPA: S41 family peptidase [Pyrinomonadaceae bacterium]|nr:S41 family peptidase [Pyrinomonadaceae bacterium]
MRIKTAHLVFLLVCLVALAPEIAAQKKKPRVKPVTATVTVSASKMTPAERRQDAFFNAWVTLDQEYFDKSFSGLDWNAIRKEYQPRVRAARSDIEFHRILEEMIGRLGKSHLEIITPEYFETIEKAKVRARLYDKQLKAKKQVDEDETEPTEDEGDLFGDSGNIRYGIGVELKMLGDQIVITRVEDQSGATIAGLKPGYVIEKINGVSLSETIASARLAGSSASDIKFLLPLQIVESFLNGDADTSVILTCLDETDKPREFTAPRLKLAGETISLSKNLPDQFLRYESFSLSPTIGYIKFNAFAMPVIPKFCDSLTVFRDKSAIIVDLRGNIGGVIASMIGLSGMLTDKELNFGSFVTRTGSQSVLVGSKNKNFKGRIVLLVDGQSMSASEMFATGLRSNNRVVVVGDRTGGKSLPAIWKRLSTGAVMMYPIADFITIKGKSLEGVGVEPDYVVSLDRKSLLQAVDTQLNKAIAIAAEESAFNKPAEPKVIQPVTALSTGAILPPPKAIATPTPKPTPGPSEPRALKLVNDFAAAVGGVSAVKQITSYEARGNIETGNGENTLELYSARQSPDKYVTVIKSPAVGEIREVINGKASFLQSDFGSEQKLYVGQDLTRVHLLSPFFNGLDLEYLRGLKYEGEYEVEGRIRRILSATSPEGYYVGLSFDDKTRLLATFSLPGVMYTLSDYRKVDGVLLPFHIDTERVMKTTLSSITINPKLDPSTFEKKENCFDKAN